jgi:membrane carboxypeptidase/penicillin-binding protein PbpC
LLPTSLCPQRRLEWFIPGTQPKQYDNLFQKFTIDSATGQLATDQTPDSRRVERVYEVLPQEARDWGLRHGIEPPPIAAHAVVAASAGAGQGLHLLQPDPYTVYQLSPVVPFDTQKIRFAAAVSPGTKQLTYLLDDQPIDSVSAEPWETWWALVPGKHILKATATLEDGRTETSDPTIFIVVSYVPPEDQASSGEVK